jgi:hypothetical protein
MNNKFYKEMISIPYKVRLIKQMGYETGLVSYKGEGNVGTGSAPLDVDI